MPLQRFHCPESAEGQVTATPIAPFIATKHADALLNLPDPSCNAPLSGIAKPLRATGCPSLRRIVQAKDGGICRIKLPCGQLSSKQARAIADIATRYAGNVITITNRSNLQLRGVNAIHADALTQILIDAGLGADDNDADEVRNVLVSPTAGIDPQQLVDTLPLASQLLTMLQTEKRFHELSAKFALSLDGGESMAMLEHPHDVWLSALQIESQTLFAFGFAGVPPVQDVNTPAALAAVAPQHALTLIAAVLHQFLDCASLEQKRMRDLLQQMTAAEFLQQLRQRIDFPLFDDTHIKQWRRTPARQHAHIGTIRQRNDRIAVGAVPGLSQLDGAQLQSLALVAEQYGIGSLRLTPWQSVLVPHVDAANADTVLKQLRAHGFHIDKHEPLSQLIACTGSAGCDKGLANTKADAVALADLLAGLPAESMDVHLTGCTRSCACAHTASFTLLAVDTARYDLYRKAGISDFGTRLASNISIGDAANYLRQFSNPEHTE